MTTTEVKTDRRGALRSVGAQLARIIGSTVITLWVLSLITFFGTNLRSPEGRAMAALGHEASAAQIQAFIVENGLSDPVILRYLKWLGDFVVGNSGTSIVSGIPINDLVMPRVMPSLTLALLGLAFSVIIGVLMGIYMARRIGSKSDNLLFTTSTTLTALPEFVVGIILIFVFANLFKWLPVNSSNPFSLEPFPLAAFVLPVLTLSTAVVPYVARMTRAAVSESLRTEAIKSAYLRGIPTARVTYRYAVRMSAIPMLGSVAIASTYLFGSVLVVEQVFGFPGLGQLTVAAVSQGDISLVQACAMTIGVLIVVFNIAIETLAIEFNPRLKTKGK